MGLFDQLGALGNLSPDQQQGLLAAAQAFAQAGAPSRTPVSFAQALSSGLGGYNQGLQNAQKIRQDQEESSLQNQLRALQVQGLAGELNDKEVARRRQLAINAELQKTFGQPKSQSGLPPASMPTNTAPGVPLDTSGGVQLPDWAMSSQAPQSSAPQTQPGSLAALHANRLLQEADVYSRNGDYAGADQRYQAAAKLIPQVDKIETAYKNGKPVRVITYKDGTEQVSSFDAKPDFVEVDTGGAKQFVDRNLLQSGQTFNKTQTPDSIASNALGWANYNKPQFNADAGGFVSAPTKLNPSGVFTPLAGLPNKGPKLTEDQAKATGWLVQADNAYQNLKSVAFDDKGKIAPAARPGTADAVAAIPGLSGVGNYFRTADRQKFIQASSSLSEALLRAATGAGVNKDEAKQKVDEITPVWGEDPSVTEQKFNSIPLYIESLKARSGGGASQATEILRGRPSTPGKGTWRIEQVN